MNCGWEAWKEEKIRLSVIFRKVSVIWEKYIHQWLRNYKNRKQALSVNDWIAAFFLKCFNDLRRVSMSLQCRSIIEKLEVLTIANLSITVFWKVSVIWEE